MDQPPRILIVERDRVAADALEQALQRHGYQPVIAHSGDAVIEALEHAQSSESFGVVIADQDSAGLRGGLTLIRRLHDGWPDVVPIVVSGYRKVESAVQAMRLGAADYLLKPVVETELIDAIERAVQRHLLLADQGDETDQNDAALVVAEAGCAEHTPLDGADADAQPWKPTPLADAMKAPERRILLAALEANGWNRQETARQLDINRTTLYKKIRQHKLDEPA